MLVTIFFAKYVKLQLHIIKYLNVSFDEMLCLQSIVSGRLMEIGLHVLKLVEVGTDILNDIEYKALSTVGKNAQETMEKLSHAI